MIDKPGSFRRLALMAVLGLAGLTACDPYQPADSSKPQLLLVLATDGTHPEMVTSVAANAAAAAGNNIVNGTIDPAGTATMTLQDYSTTCSNKTTHMAPAAGLNVWYIQVSRVLDGTSVTADVAGTTCKPAAGIKLTRTVAGVATDLTATASVCFNPQTPDGGSYVIVYPEGATVDALGNVTVNPLTPSAAYLFTGTVKDHSNNSLPLSVTVNTPVATTDLCP